MGEGTQFGRLARREKKIKKKEKKKKKKKENSLDPQLGA